MIRLSHVYKEYPRTGLAVNDVTFHIRKGEFAFLVGHSGAGKSTLMRMIHMAEKPTRGEVRVSGHSSTRIKSREIALLRRKIGYVFQDFRLLPNRTAADNVAFALEVTGARPAVIKHKVSKLLAMVGLAAKAEAVPSELSGGEQQRVAVARALVHDPLVLLADEPTGNLDPYSTRGIFDLFRNINTSGTAVLLATHNMDLVKANKNIRLLELDHGQLVFDSAPDA